MQPTPILKRPVVHFRFTSQCSNSRDCGITGMGLAVLYAAAWSFRSFSTLTQAHTEQSLTLNFCNLSTFELCAWFIWRNLSVRFFCVFCARGVKWNCSRVVWNVAVCLGVLSCWIWYRPTGQAEHIVTTGGIRLYCTLSILSKWVTQTAAVACTTEVGVAYSCTGLWYYVTSFR